MRKIKQSDELNKIKRAVNITAKALTYARRIIHPGLREIEIAAELERFIRYEGARTTSFETIVASGENAIFPHHLTSNRKLKKNDSLLITLIFSAPLQLITISFLTRVHPYQAQIAFHPRDVRL